MSNNPLISIIIPTYNRAEILKITLSALYKEQISAIPEWETIVVDDGSTDNTIDVLHFFSNDFKNFSYISQSNKKQGAARNAAMSIAKGQLFIFLGDDIIPEKDFLYTHWNHYIKNMNLSQTSNSYAAIGRIKWHPSIKKTPFKEWINEYGLQFGFKLIRDKEDVAFNFFYTANIAISRDLYDKLGGFDDAFNEYGWEDIELGYRYIKQSGVHLRYIPEAIGYHLHDITVTSYCKRQFKVGYSAASFYRMYPELASFLKIKKINPLITYLRPLIWLGAKVFEYFDNNNINTIQFLNKIMTAYYLMGLKKGLSK